MAEIFIGLIFCLLGMYFTWLITYRYYKKNLDDQAIANQNVINEIRKLIPQQAWETKEGARLKYIDLGIEEYNHLGTPKGLIDTLNISQEEKAEIYDTVLLRVKGRVGKSNPYR